jgi:hypothetical protein
MAFTMMKSLVLLTVASLVSSLCKAGNISSYSPFIQTLAASIPGLKVVRTSDLGDYHEVGVMTFSGTIHGIPVELSGTAEVRVDPLPSASRPLTLSSQSIYAQFTTLHPHVVADYNANNAPLSTVNASLATVREPRNHERRNQVQPIAPFLGDF